MSKIDGIKEQYPHLDMSLIDVLKKFDTSGTNKYIPLFCKLFNKHLDFSVRSSELDNHSKMLHALIEDLTFIGVDITSFSTNELYMVSHFFQMFNRSDIRTFKKFMDFSEKKLIENKDITSYKDLSGIECAVSLAELKNMNKELTKSVIKEHEDDTWLIIRPLTHEASKKYGANTKWCTTSEGNLETFIRYWSEGILLYFINKKTGLKVGCFKPLKYKESHQFWSSADQMVDYLCSGIDDYLSPIIKRILSSTKTNSNLCSPEMVEKIYNDYEYKVRYLRSTDEIHEVATPTPISDQEPNYQNEGLTISNYVSNITVPLDQANVFKIDYNTDIA